MTKFQDGTIHTSQVMDCQVHAIGKAIRRLFTDPVNISYTTGTSPLADIYT